jgi:hypothetical protein
MKIAHTTTEVLTRTTNGPIGDFEDFAIAAPTVAPKKFYLRFAMPGCDITTLMNFLSFDTRWDRLDRRPLLDRVPGAARSSNGARQSIVQLLLGIEIFRRNAVFCSATRF